MNPTWDMDDDDAAGLDALLAARRGEPGTLDFEPVPVPVVADLPAGGGGDRPPAVTLSVPRAMFDRLVEHVEENDFCYFCDCHPGWDGSRYTHAGHADGCPLKRVPKEGG